MSVALYMDVHVHAAVTEQLRRRGVDVVTAQDDGALQLPDDQLFDRPTTLGRVLFTHDVRFKALAEDWLAAETHSAACYGDIRCA